MPRGTILDQFGRPLNDPSPAPAGGGGGRSGGGGSRFSAYTRGAGFYGNAAGGAASIGLLGGRFGLAGAGAAAGAVFAVGALRDLSAELVNASAQFETFERTVRATEQSSEDAAVRWQALLDIAEETVGIDVAGLVQYNSQLRVIGVEAERVDAILRATVKSVSELGRGVHVSREALNQLTDGIVRNHLNVRDWRAIVARIPQFLEAASTALGQTVLSLDDFRDAADENGISISEGIIRSLERLDETAQGLQGTYVAAVDRFTEASFKLKATLGEDLKDTATPIIAGIAEQLNALNEALNQTPEEKLRLLFERLEEVRGSRTILGDNPLEREALGQIRLFLQRNPDALPNTSAGAFRSLESDARRAARPTVEQPTGASLEFFANVRENRRLQEEFLRADLQRAGGDYAQQIADTERQITDTVGRLRSALEVDTAEQTASQQAIVQGIQSELNVLFQKLPVLKELANERERELRATKELRREAEIATEKYVAQFEGFPGIAGDPTRTDEREARRQREAEAETRSFIRRNAGYTGLSPVDAETRASREANRVFAANRRTQEFIERNRGYAGILTDDTRFPSQQALDERSERRFRELGRGRGGDRGVQRLVDEALGGGFGNIDTERLREIYDARIDGERRALRAAERSARQYERIWERTFSSVADLALDAIFQRNVSFGEALSQIAQQSLSDFAGHYLRQLIGGGAAGGGTAAGAGVALGGAGLLFPQEFSNLFEGIGNELISLTINVADLINNSDDSLIQLDGRIRDLKEQGF